MMQHPVVLLSRRAVVSRFRHPSLYLPDLVGPLLFTAVLWGSFAKTKDLRAFPTVNSYLDFALVGAVIVGVFFSATDVADDIEADIAEGFFDRLIVSPVARSAMMLSRLAGAAVYAVFESLVLMAILVAFGARIRGGIPAVLVVCAVTTVMAVATGGLAASLALRRGAAERVAPLFIPLSFMVLFVSSAYFPRNLMEGWFKVVASVNPISWLMEDLRHQVIVGFDPVLAAKAMAIVAALAACTVFSAVRAISKRAESS